MPATVKKTGSKKSKRNVPNGVVHIQSTFNNTIVSITDTSGHVISWSSAGASGFKGARKGTPFGTLRLDFFEPVFFTVAGMMFEFNTSICK